MTDCDHSFTLESIENRVGAEGKNLPRTAWLLCTLCSLRQSRITTRTDAEINAELAELNT